MLNENLQDVLIDQVWLDWKKKGFPKYPTDLKWRNLAFQQLMAFKRELIVDRQRKIMNLDEATETMSDDDWDEID